MKRKQYAITCLLALSLSGSLGGCSESNDAAPAPDPAAAGEASAPTGAPGGGTTTAGQAPAAQGGGEGPAVTDMMAGTQPAPSGDMAGAQPAPSGDMAAGPQPAPAGDMASGQPAPGGADGGPGATGAGPTGAPTFSAIYDEILVGRCSGPICHSGASGGKLVMTNKADAYAALVSTPAEGVTLPGICEGMPPNCADVGVMRVAPNDPEGSLLLDKVENENPRCGCAMPTSPPRLSDAEIEQIRAWIMLGAPND